MEAYRESLFLIDKWLEVLSTLYFPTRLTVVDNQFSTYSIYSSKDLMKVIRDEQQNPYIKLFRERFLPSIIADRPELIGVSITATSQIIPGLTLCRLIKETAPDIHLTIGGSIFTRLVDNLRRCPSLFDITDDFVVFEGETALLELVNQMAGKKDFSKVPNLIYRQNGKITVNQPFYSENVNQLPAPNYDGFPLGPLSLARAGAARAVLPRLLLQGLRVLRLDAGPPEFPAEGAGPHDRGTGMAQAALWRAKLLLYR